MLFKRRLQIPNREKSSVITGAFRCQSLAHQGRYGKTQPMTPVKFVLNALSPTGDRYPPHYTEQRAIANVMVESGPACPFPLSGIQIQCGQPVFSAHPVSGGGKEKRAPESRLEKKQGQPFPYGKLRREWSCGDCSYVISFLFAKECNQNQTIGHANQAERMKGKLP